MSIELNRQKQALAKKVLGQFTHRFPTLVNIIDNDLNAATWHLIERFMDSIGGRFLFSEELIADVKVLATHSDTNLDSVKLPDDMICLIRDERLRAYELYCKDKALNVKPDSDEFIEELTKLMVKNFLKAHKAANEVQRLYVPLENNGWDNIIPSNDWAVRSQLNSHRRNLKNWLHRLLQFWKVA